MPRIETTNISFRPSNVREDHIGMSERCSVSPPSSSTTPLPPTDDKIEIRASDDGITDNVVVTAVNEVVATTSTVDTADEVVTSLSDDEHLHLVTGEKGGASENESVDWLVEEEEEAEQEEGAVAIRAGRTAPSTSSGATAIAAAADRSNCRRKYNKLDMQKRMEIIELSRRGVSRKNIARTYRSSVSTIAGIVKRFESENRVQLIPQSGRPGKLSESDKFFIVSRLKESGGNVSMQKLRDCLQSERGTIVHAETIRRFVRDYWRHQQRLLAATNIKEGTGNDTA